MGRHRRRITSLEGIEDKINLKFGDIRDENFVTSVIKNSNYIFNLAAQVSYLDSINKPLLDLEINCRGTLNVLEGVRKFNPEAKVLFSSSRLVYGRLTTSPISEDYQTDPLSIYGIHKLMAEKYHSFYHKYHNLNTVIARIPNPYGPRQNVTDMKSGAIVGWVVNELLLGKEVKIFGEGFQKRSYVYIDDLLESLLLLIINKKALKGEVFNVGSQEIVNFKEMVETAYQVVKSGTFKNVPWPKNFEKNETGDYVPDLNKLKQFTGFTATTSLKEGIENLVLYLRSEEKH